ncbi:Fur family transcriptional regulator [Desulfurivibrio alkaliphilus]|uniref:Ferric uptake regulator, Fur family n=1 Tax=Desulfurivibrio alkaliphilus (strain DSM 19089 / UNIQEM U267 / AHT2) TaxID=589865 RepID=D6Z5K6_DESAT|nr:transcriptional repressor [Desulfurivibrio alkaliphilus]ADH86743.1 ferric uptake regulator, Fur family [Desulfurivibrio alkaliphilus AHT 2]
MSLGTSLRVTKQRQVLLDELCKVRSHPTADELYQMVRRRLPRISLGTVYRNLELMAENGMIQKLAVGGTQKRFDGNAAPHYHVRCLKCDRVDDLDLSLELDVEQKARKHTDFTIVRHSLEFAGLCPECC